MSSFFDDFFGDVKRKCVGCKTTENLTPYGQDFYICPKCQEAKQIERNARAEVAQAGREAGERFDAAWE